MKKYVNGQYIEMTAEEIAAIQAQVAEQMAEEAKRSLTIEEVVRLVIAKTINSITIDDKTALRMVAYYPDWTVGTAYAAGDRVVYNGYLYKVLQAHTAQDTWRPGAGTESLYTRIDEQHDGTKYDPIPYNGNMALENGKYYSQGGVRYKCIRDTGNPVYNALSELVGLYVEAV